jgi:adenylate kinase family enzyme
MIKIAFLLGRPGTGKSTLAQLIEASAQRKGWATQHFYDYKYLQDMFQQEIEEKVPLEKRAFRQKGPEACHGFDVLDFNVLDTALEQMAKEIPTEELDHSEENKLFLIEFARKEYDRALHIFDYDILRNAHLLYVKLGLETCIERVQERANVHRLRSGYDHYVSEEIMRDYYGGDNWLDGQISEYLNYLQSDLVHVSLDEIDNSGTYQELEGKVEKIVDLLVPELVLVW